MNRDQVLDKLARGRDKWFSSALEALPSWVRYRGMRLGVDLGEVALLMPEGEERPRPITKQDWLDKRRQLGLTDPLVTGKPEEWPEERIDAIGQNGNEGEHYSEEEVSRELLERRIEDRCSMNKAAGADGADSPIGTGLKYDGDKVRMDLLTDGMPRALEAVGEILTFGAQKYKAHSWKAVEGNTERYNAAKVRHMIARAKGEERDQESGMLHLAHEACNALFLLELALLAAEDDEEDS